ncbi:MAG: DUF6788 family protein [Nevskiaceae bacterium]
MPTPTEVPTHVRELARRLAEAKPMRRGSLSVRYLKCNKAGCGCADDQQARHGPYTSVVRTVGGTSRSRSVSAAQAPVLRQQVEAGQQFRKDVEAYWQACERWSDQELDAPQAAAETEAAKKGGSKKRSPAKSPPKSKR